MVYVEVYYRLEFPLSFWWALLPIVWPPVLSKWTLCVVRGVTRVCTSAWSDLLSLFLSTQTSWLQPFGQPWHPLTAILKTQKRLCMCVWGEAKKLRMTLSGKSGGGRVWQFRVSTSVSLCVHTCVLTVQVVIWSKRMCACHRVHVCVRRLLQQLFEWLLWCLTHFGCCWV